MNIGNVFNKFFFGKFRFIKRIASIAIKAYRDIRWEYYTRKYDKISIAGGAQWLRQSKRHEWDLFVSHNVEAKTAVFELLDYYRKVWVSSGIEVGEYNVGFIEWYAPLCKLGFGISEEMIEYATNRKPNTRDNVSNTIVSINWRNRENKESNRNAYFMATNTENQLLNNCWGIQYSLPL